MPLNPDSPLARLMATLPRAGKVEWIGLRPARDEAMIATGTVEAIAGAAHIKGDIYDADIVGRIAGALGGMADLVMSDMAAPATGHAATDHLKVMALVEAAYDVARQLLAPGGAFVAKVLAGGAERDVLDLLKQDFAKVHHAKPAASRADSREIYLVATGFRGPAGEA